MHFFIGLSITLFITLIWGVTFTVTRETIAIVPPWLFLALRFGIALVTLIPWLLVPENRFWRVKTPWRSRFTKEHLGLGVVLAAAYVFQTTGLKYTTVAHSAFITGLLVIAVPLLNRFLFKNALSAKILVASFVACSGLFLLCWPALSASSSQVLGVSFLWGDFLTLLCALGFSMQIIFISRLTHKTSPFEVTFIQIFFGLVACLIGTFFSGEYSAETMQLLASSPKHLANLFFCGVLATSLAIPLQCIAQRYIAANRAALLYTFEPVFAAIFAWFWVNEKLGLVEILGCAFILVATLIAELPLAWLLGKPSAPRSVVSSHSSELP